MITEKSLAYLSPSFLLRKEVFGGLLYDKKTHRTYLLNEAGTLILSLCERKRIIRDVFELFKKEYTGVDKEMIQNDFNRFVNDAIEKKFVVVE